MSNLITIIVPEIPGEPVSSLSEWISSLPELSLVGNVRVISVPWEQPHAGSVKDWVATMQTITRHWDDSAGFVIWAPEYTLLELAGSIRLMLEDPGKPLIFFAEQRPKQVFRSENKRFGLKSTLINATYLALSQIAEVVVLAQGEVIRPNECGWGDASQQLRVDATATSIATIDFQLTIHQKHKLRKETPLQSTFSKEFSHKVQCFSWFPGTKTEISHLTNDHQAIIFTNAQFWGHPEVLSLQKELQEKGVPTIWQSKSPWSKKPTFSESQLAVSHEHPWWVTLVTQFAFGNQDSTKKAFHLIDQKCH